MKLHVLSDLHTEFCGFRFDADAVRAADVIVLAGDISVGTEGIAWVRKHIERKPVVYVAGNHEFYRGHWQGTLERMRHAALRHKVHFLENDAVLIDGIRFLGATLWTDFDYFGNQRRHEYMKLGEQALNDFRLIYTDEAVGTPLTAQLTIDRHVASRRWLEDELTNGDPARTVVVTHHYPDKLSTAPEYLDDPLTPCFGSELPHEVISRCALWIHGHTHSSSDYWVGGSERRARVICNPRGYPIDRVTGQFENPMFNRTLVIDLGDGSMSVHSTRKLAEVLDMLPFRRTGASPILNVDSSADSDPRDLGIPGAEQNPERK
jgi:predicted phosphodiesterase